MFLQIALAFPTVVFTVAVLVSVGYWVVTLAGGLDFDDTDLGGGEVDLGTDTAADAPQDPTGSDGSALQTILGGLHLTGIPPVIVISLTSVFAWLCSYVITALISLPDTAPVVQYGGGSIVGAASLIVGLLATSVLARPLARAFVYTRALDKSGLVGRVAVVRTGSVGADFGQAGVSVPGSGELTVQVRAEEPNDLSAGSPALLVEYDDHTGAFWVTDGAGLQ